MVISKFHSDTGLSRHAKLMGGKHNETHWAPNTDVYVTETGLVIKVELAGMKREDLELSIENSSLKISGQREDGCRTTKCKFLVMEINYGSFETVIDLPSGYDLSQAKASYQNGFLRVDVPVLAKSTSRLTISVTGS
ncbi:MAG: small heat shock protein [Verrucomicrobiales bacterium]|nr:small heat shock protein [Verrucomicrobiales bacterium]MDB6129178.1 small heat shock protein [Verrucomicrobiales bacterium]